MLFNFALIINRDAPDNVLAGYPANPKAGYDTGYPVRPVYSTRYPVHP
jgi:hypothetical protein